MARPKKGTKGAEEATRKWRKTMQRKYGGAAGVHDMMCIIGSKGGQNGHTGGFAANPELARRAGSIGGKKSRRTGVTTGQAKEKEYIWKGGPNAELVFKEEQEA